MSEETTLTVTRVISKTELGANSRDANHRRENLKERDLRELGYQYAKKNVKHTIEYEYQDSQGVIFRSPETINRPQLQFLREIHKYEL